MLWTLGYTLILGSSFYLGIKHWSWDQPLILGSSCDLGIKLWSWDQALIFGSSIDLWIKHWSWDQAFILGSSIDLGIKLLSWDQALDIKIKIKVNNVHTKVPNSGKMLWKFKTVFYIYVKRRTWTHINKLLLIIIKKQSTIIPRKSRPRPLKKTPHLSQKILHTEW